MIQATPTLGFVEAINTSTSKIFQFHGRSRRSEFWWTQLLVYVASIALTPFVGLLLDLLTIPLTFRRLHDTGRSGWWWGFGALLKLLFLLTFGHDIYMSIINSDNIAGNEEQFGKILLIKYGVFAIAIGIYQIILLVLCCLDGEEYENQYGPSPKYIDDENLEEE